jgi:hypothetical protein
MLDNIDKKALINDVAKWATILVVAHVIVKYLTNAPMFDEASVREILATLAGVAAYHAVVVQVVKPQ